MKAETSSPGRLGRPASGAHIGGGDGGAIGVSGAACCAAAAFDSAISPAQRDVL
jgi:hypothetical protein